jgi:hypothetical protein
MVRKSGLLAGLTVLAWLLPAASGLAQPAPTGTGPKPAPSGTVSADEPDPLPGLPRPPDAPGSLFQKASTNPPYTCAPLPGPYFELDPRLDPPDWPQPGWFAGFDIGIVAPHVKNRLTDTVQSASGIFSDTIHLPSAALSWTVSPRVTLGYRLPSGFGEFALAYRNLATDGSESLPGPGGSADLRSRLDVNSADLDYLSREMSLWPNCEMKWRFGLRMANIFFDSRLNETFVDGILATHTTNHYLGGGPHIGVELARPWQETGLTWVARADGATLLGRVDQDFLEVNTTTGPGGPFGTGETRRSNPQSVPMLHVFLGVTWQPPQYPNWRLSAGYEYEYWWNVGRLSTGTSRGEWSEQGFLMSAAFNF